MMNLESVSEAETGLRVLQHTRNADQWLVNPEHSIQFPYLYINCYVLDIFSRASCAHVIDHSTNTLFDPLNSNEVLRKNIATTLTKLNRVTSFSPRILQLICYIYLPSRQLFSQTRARLTKLALTSCLRVFACTQLRHASVVCTHARWRPSFILITSSNNSSAGHSDCTLTRFCAILNYFQQREGRLNVKCFGHKNCCILSLYSHVICTDCTTNDVTFCRIDCKLTGKCAYIAVLSQLIKTLKPDSH